MRILRLVVTLALLSGSPPTARGDTDSASTPTAPASQELVGLASRIAVADRILATNWASDYPGFSISISGAEVKRIVRAVSTARFQGNQEHPDVEYDWKLQFYRATNSLAAICFSHDAFLFSGKF